MSEGEGGSGPGTSESSMMEMIRLLREEDRIAEVAREKKRDKKDKEDAKKLHERQLELEELRQKGVQELEEKKEELRQKGLREAEEWRQKRQEEYDAKQLEQQLRLMKAQVELAESTNKLHREGQDQDRKRNRALAGIADWKEGDDLEEFFEMAERKMTAADIGREEWIEVIDQKLKGQALLAWQNAVARGESYFEVKGRVLEICGYTPAMAAEAFYEAKSEQCKGLTASQLLYKGRQMFRRMVAPEKPSATMEFAVLKGWIIHVVPKGAKRVLGVMPVGTEVELIAALQHFLSIDGDSKVGQAPTFRAEAVGVGERFRDRAEAAGVGERPRDRYGPLVCFKCGRSGHKAVDCWQASVSGQNRPSGSEGTGSKINCFTCGVEGHKSPQCPKNIRGEKGGAYGGQEGKAKPVLRIGTGGRTDTPQVAGLVNGIKTQILLDSGAGITLVPEVMVDGDQLTGERVAVRTFWASQRLTLPIACVSFEVGEEKWMEVVGVIPRQKGVEEEVIYSLNLRSDRGRLLVQQIGGEDPAGMRRVTTQEEGKKQEQEVEEEKLELAACSPAVLPLPSGSEVRNGPEAEVKRIEEEEEEEGEAVTTVEGPKGISGDSELEISVVKKEKGDRETLVTETRSDPSLRNWREMAKKEWTEAVELETGDPGVKLVKAGTEEEVARSGERKVDGEWEEGKEKRNRRHWESLKQRRKRMGEVGLERTWRIDNSPIAEAVDRGKVGSSIEKKEAGEQIVKVDEALKAETVEVENLCERVEIVEKESYVSELEEEGKGFSQRTVMGGTNKDEVKENKAVKVVSEVEEVRKGFTQTKVIGGTTKDEVKGDRAVKVEAVEQVVKVDEASKTETEEMKNLCGNAEIAEKGFCVLELEGARREVSQRRVIGVSNREAEGDKVAKVETVEQVAKVDEIPKAETVEVGHLGGSAEIAEKESYVSELEEAGRGSSQKKVTGGTNRDEIQEVKFLVGARERSSRVEIPSVKVLAEGSSWCSSTGWKAEVALVVEQRKPNVRAVLGEHAEVRDPVEDSRGGSRYRDCSSQLEQASQGLVEKHLAGKQGVLVIPPEPRKTVVGQLVIRLMLPRSSSLSLGVVVWMEEMLKTFLWFLVSFVDVCILTVPFLRNQSEEVGVGSDEPAEDDWNRSWGRCGDEPHREKLNRDETQSWLRGTSEKGNRWTEQKHKGNRWTEQKHLNIDNVCRRVLIVK